MSIKHSNETADGYYDLGRYYHARSQWAGASEGYKKALALDARYYEAHNALGVGYSMQGKTDLAVEHFRSAIAIAPQRAHLHNNLGHAYYLQGNNQNAIDSLEAAAALDPRNQRILHNLNLAYERAGLTEKSEQATHALNTVRARDSAAVASVLAKPGATVRKAPASTSAESERRAVGNPADDVFSRALPASPTVHLTVTRVPTTGTPLEGLGLRRSDAEATLVLLGSNVYELRVPGTPAAPPLAPVMRVLRTETAHDLAPFRIEVSNGNGVSGIAREVGEHLKRAGFNVVRVTNQLSFKQSTTEVQYRAQRLSDAERLASVFQQSLIVRGDALRADIHVRVVLGQDVRDAVALFNRETIRE
jgi:hypothetical protein